MIYLQLLLIVIPIVSSSASTKSVISAPINCENCPQLTYTHHYTAKGCIPVSRSGCSNCVEKFDCPISQRDSNKCYYGGSSYEVDQDVQVSNPCTMCRCTSSGENETDISCAHIECPELFSRPFDNDNSTCYYSYSPGRCCGSKRCPRSEDALKPSVTCSYGGKVYKEGQQIDMPDCYTCTCTADFNASTVKDSPACHQHVCYFNTKMLENGCVPVYLPSGCCYSQFHCPPPNLEQRRKHCAQSHYYGYCDQNMTRYHFDSYTNSCLPFTYSGCGGSVNTFESQTDCMDYCTSPDPIIDVDPTPGHCIYNGMLYPVGYSLQTAPGYSCSCRIPPDFTCILS